MLSTSTIQGNSTPEAVTADWDAKFHIAIPSEYIGVNRQWLGLSS